MHAKEIKKCFQNRLMMTALLLLVTFTGALGYLTESPNNNLVLKGRTTVFICCSNEQGLFYWKHKPVGSKSTSDINDFNGLVNGFQGRFNVTRSSRPECYSLFITDVKLEDAGTYTCTDKQGLGQSIGWELVILESLECQETYQKEDYMGINNFDLAQDVIGIKCISIYRGNLVAKPICKWSSGTKLHDTYQRFTKMNTSMTLNIQMPATKEMNNDQLYCYVHIEMGSTENQNLTTWESTQFIINSDAVFQQKIISQCIIDGLSLDCHPPCKYQMIQFSNGSRYFEIGYPSQTHRKFYVLLQSNSLSETTLIPSSKNKPVEIQVTPSGTMSIVWAVLITSLCVSGLLVGAFFSYRQTRNRRLQPTREERALVERNQSSGEKPTESR